eukprot:3255200-Prymnesium_polylepis.1
MPDKRAKHIAFKPTHTSDCTAAIATQSTSGGAAALLPPPEGNGRSMAAEAAQTKRARHSDDGCNDSEKEAGDEPSSGFPLFELPDDMLAA